MATKSIKSKLLVILGPTSTGKTDLALNLAKKFSGELVSCDSRQVYIGLDVGTGKMSSKISNFQKQNGRWIINGVNIWMYDVVDPKKQYTVFDYVKDAGKVIRDIWKREKLPIIVVGTGLYLKALIDGLPNLAIPVDKNLRKKLEKLSKEKLQEKLQKIAPSKWAGLNNSDRENPRRLIRAIEIAIKTKAKNKVYKNLTIVNNLSTADRFRFQKNILKIGLAAPREILFQKIDKRVVSRIDQDMIDEARKLCNDGLTFKRMRQLGLEYGVLANYLEGKTKSKEQFIKILQGKIHDFARRQITWFKKEKEVFWFDITDRNCFAKVENLVAKWYDNFRYGAKN